MPCLFICSQSAYAQKKLVIIGSSTSACFNVSYTDCYVGRINAWYNQQAPYDTIIDNSLTKGGYSVFRAMPTSFVSPYADTNLHPDPTRNITAALAMNPNVILVNFPTNSYDTLRVDSILYCLRTIRDSAAKKGVPCYVTTTQPRTSLPYFATSAVKKKLALLKDSILAEFGSFALDFWTGMINPPDSAILPAYNSGDDIHFNGAGHAVLAQRVISANIFSSAALPIQLLRFNATNSNSNIVISWSAAGEDDVVHYELQRSVDGQQFNTIVSQSPTGGSGSHDYQYTDRQPLAGWNYYRLLVRERSGKTDYSPVLKVLNNANGVAIVKMLTQSSQIILNLQSNAAQNLSVEVLSSTGMVIQQGSRHIDAGGSTLPIDIAPLQGGIYYIKLAAPGFRPVVASFVKN